MNWIRKMGAAEGKPSRAAFEVAAKKYMGELNKAGAMERQADALKEAALAEIKAIPGVEVIEREIDWGQPPIYEVYCELDDGSRVEVNVIYAPDKPKDALWETQNVLREVK